VKNRGTPEEDRIRDARRAAERVLKDSELKELWDETADSSLWKEVVEELLRRLSPTVHE